VPAIPSACASMEAEREYLRALAAELRHHRLQRGQVADKLAPMTQSDPQLRPMGATLDTGTTAQLIAERLDSRDYANSRIDSQGV
jgi:hypothetical protein